MAVTSRLKLCSHHPMLLEQLIPLSWSQNYYIHERKIFKSWIRSRI